MPKDKLEDETPESNPKAPEVPFGKLALATDPATKTIEDAVTWVRRTYGGSSASDMSSAIRSLSSVLLDDSPRNIVWFHEHLDAIVSRWAAKNSKSSTARTYKNRADRLMTEYKRFLSNPHAYKIEPLRKRRAAPKKVEETASTAAPAPEHPHHAAPRSHAIPLPGDRVFRFTLPEDLTMADVGRVTYHLKGYADDFELPG